MSDGEEYFLWRGKEYKFDLKEPVSPEQAHKIGWSNEKIKNFMELLEKEKLAKQAQEGVTN